MARADDRGVVEVLLDDGPDVPPDGDGAPGPGRRRARGRPGPSSTHGPPPTTAATRPDGPRDRRRRRRAWLAAPLLLALVVVLGAVDARADRREQDALAVAADVPGVLASLAEPLDVLWRLPAGPPTSGLGERVVTVADGALVGLDGATGERRWAIPLVGDAATCPVGVPGLAGGAGAGDSLVCFGVGRPEAAHGGVIAHAVDAVDGEVRTELRGSRLLIGATALEGDAVLVGSGAGKVIVSRTELEHGRARWAVDAHGIEPGVVDLLVHADRQVVALESRTTVVLDARDGRTLGRWSAASDGVTPARGRVVSHPGAGFGVWESRYAGRWYTPDGTPGPALDGEPVEPDVDDGRTPGVVVLGSAAGDRVRAVDVASGDELWDRPAPARLLLRLGGRLMVTAGERLEAWDATTGEVLWSVPLDPTEVPALGVPWTDGVRLVVRGEDDDGPRLTAYRLADGARVWRSPLPAGTRSVTVLGDRLVATGRLDGTTESAAVLG
jgi:outer membrane protein assembly factor BamB